MDLGNMDLLPRLPVLDIVRALLCEEVRVRAGRG